MTSFITMVWKQNHSISEVCLYVQIIKVVEQFSNYATSLQHFYE